MDDKILSAEWKQLKETSNRMKDHIGSTLVEMRISKSDALKGFLACEIVRMEEVVNHLNSAMKLIETINNNN